MTRYRVVRRWGVAVALPTLAYTGCAHAVTVAIADDLATLGDEDTAAAGAAGLRACVECGALFAPEGERL